MSAKRTALTPAVWGVYLVIVLEFLFMISPVALHFYSAYGPILNLLHGSLWTSWLTKFFLPHFSETSSPLLNALTPLGFRLGYLGILLFLVGAVPVYWAKIFRRGAVTGGLYRWIRHPQYLALGILGLGITLIWARFMVLLSYVTMLFLYCLLARWEEKLCLDKYGDTYRELQERTGMILPRSVEGVLTRHVRLPWRLGDVHLVVVYLVVMTLTTLGAFGVREYSLSKVTSSYVGSTAVLSPALLTADELDRAYRLAGSDGSVQEALREAAAEGPQLVYVIPDGWHLPDLPLHTVEEIIEVGGGHRTPSEFDRNRYRVLFANARTHDANLMGDAIVKGAFGMDPVIIAEVDLDLNIVLASNRHPPGLIWGDIPTPLF